VDSYKSDELMALFLYFLPTIPALTNWFLGDIREEVKLTAETSQAKTSLAGSRSSHFKILFKSCFIFLQLYIFYAFIYQPLLYLLASWENFIQTKTQMDNPPKSSTKLCYLLVSLA
jgi:hypothetical protein